MALLHSDYFETLVAFNCAPSAHINWVQARLERLADFSQLDYRHELAVKEFLGWDLEGIFWPETVLEPAQVIGMLAQPKFDLALVTMGAFCYAPQILRSGSGQVLRSVKQMLGDQRFSKLQSSIVDPTYLALDPSNVLPTGLHLIPQLRAFGASALVAAACNSGSAFLHRLKLKIANEQTARFQLTREQSTAAVNFALACEAVS
jgi:hypothetical protein